MKLLFIFALVFTAGNAFAKPNVAFVNDGVEVYEVSCNGTVRSMANCYKKASEACNGSFEIFDKEESKHNGKAFGNNLRFEKRSLLFSCKKKT